MSIAVTKANFEQEVLQSDLPVLVDFWAYWCGPCMAQTPILNEIIMEHPNLMKICKVNIDEEFQLVGDYQVFSIPTLLFFLSLIHISSFCWGCWSARSTLPYILPTYAENSR